MVVNIGHAEDRASDPGVCGLRVREQDRPRFLHESRESAEAQALRLAQRTRDPGAVFVVMEAVGKVVSAGMQEAEVYRVDLLGCLEELEEVKAELCELGQ